MPYFGLFGLELSKTIVIFEISTLKLDKNESLTHTGNFGIGSAFTKDPGSAFTEGPGPGPGPLFIKYAFKYDENDAFYFVPKALYIHFCLGFLILQKNGLIRKLRLISTFLTLQSEQQIITIHILLNISRSKGNQSIKFS